MVRTRDLAGTMGALGVPMHRGRLGQPRTRTTELRQDGGPGRSSPRRCGPCRRGAVRRRRPPAARWPARQPARTTMPPPGATAAASAGPRSSMIGTRRLARTTSNRPGQVSSAVAVAPRCGRRRRWPPPAAVVRSTAAGSTSIATTWAHPIRAAATDRTPLPQPTSATTSPAPTRSASNSRHSRVEGGCPNRTPIRGRPPARPRRPEGPVGPAGPATRADGRRTGPPPSSGVLAPAVGPRVLCGCHHRDGVTDGLERSIGGQVGNQFHHATGRSSSREPRRRRAGTAGRRDQSRLSARRDHPGGRTTTGCDGWVAWLDSRSIESRRSVDRRSEPRHPSHR